VSRASLKGVLPLLAVVAAVLAIGIATRSGPTYTVHAVFTSVNGLVDTGHVEVAGFDVGEITGLSVRIGGYPVVTMQVTDDYRLRQGAHAVIELGSLAGQLNRYIALENGSGPPLPDGATIPLKNTDEPVEIDQFLSILTPRVRAQLRNLLHDAVHTFQGEGSNISQALRYSTTAFSQTAGLLGDVTADGSALRALVTRAAAGAQQLATEPAAVEGTIDHLGSLLDVAATRQEQITASLRELPSAFSSSRIALTTLGDAVPQFTQLLDVTGPALTAIDPLARALRTVSPQAVPAFRAALQLVDAFLRHSGEISKLLGAPLPQTLANLDSGVHGINPFLDQLRARAPDALGWIPLLGDVSANYNVNGHGWLVDFSPRSAPQTPVISPSCSPGWLLRPFDRYPGQLACDPWTDYAGSFVGGGRLPSSYLTPAQQAPYPGEFK
jgi:phospholipid/cholesterol/gamma-HCH transport system substrate-binding protein